MIEVIHGDCLDFDPAEHGRKFQALISDLPYSEHVHANIVSAGTMGDGSRGWHRQELAFGSLTPELLAHVAKFSACVQGWVLLYSDVESASVIRAACETALSEYVRSELVVYDEVECPEGFAGWLPWERWSQPQKSGDRPPQGWELISLFWGRRASRKAWNGPGSLTAMHHKSLRGDDKHRTEKPLDQLLDLVSWFSNGPGLPWGEHPQIQANGTVVTIPASVLEGRAFTARPAQDALAPVLDLCAGSCTTAVACALLDRACLCFELDPKGEGWSERGERRAQDALVGKLSPRDRERAERWVMGAIAEASKTPYPKATDGSDVKTWERAQRQLADANRVAEKLL